MKAAIPCAVACLGVMLAVLVPARAETAKQKLRYMTDLAGTSCSADKPLTLRNAPNGAASGTVAAPAYVTVHGGRLDSNGDSWAHVTDDKTKQRGYVRLEALSCI